ncbi:hypothetical protein ACFL35_12595 [Candidatus Riflebacteria bacterium]
MELNRQKTKNNNETFQRLAGKNLKKQFLKIIILSIWKVELCSFQFYREKE